MSDVKRDCHCPRAQHKHGTRAAYGKDHCRCFACRLANSRIDAAGRDGHGYRDPGMYTSRQGVVLRLQALHAVGFGEAEIGAHLGISKQAVRDLRTHRSPVVLASTSVRVAEVYDRLWNQTPVSQFRARTVNWAARNGWLPPLALDDDRLDDPTYQPGSHLAGGVDIDEVAVERAMRGDHVPLTQAERTEAWRRLEARGLSARVIGELLGESSRTVQRRRAA